MRKQRKKRSTTLFNRKKGFIVGELIMFVIVLVVVATISIFAYKAFSDFKIDSYDEFTSNESKQLMDDVDTRYPTFMDGVVVFLLIALWMVTIVAAYVSDVHPIIFGMMIFIIVFIAIAGAFLSNYFEEMMQDDDMSSLTTSFPKTMWIMSHIVEMIIMVALSVALALFGKNRAG